MAIVLLVDPSQTIRRVVEMVFKGSGHDVIAATSATEGQQALVRYQPAVAIVNYMLPDGSGLELCKLIKANPPTAHVPVVVLGGSYAPFDPGQASASGAAAVVMKPFKTAELFEPVSQLISAGYVSSDAAPDQPAAPQQAARPAAPAQPPSPPARPAPAPTQVAPVAAVPRPKAPAAEQPRYAPPAQAAPAPPRRSAPAAVPRPTPPAPQTPPPRQPAAYRGQPEPAPEPVVEDATRRVVRSEATAQPPVQAQAAVQAQAPVQVDREAVRAAVEDLLPQIALDTLQKMLADWLEARLRNYIHELVRQELSRYQRQ